MGRQVFIGDDDRRPAAPKKGPLAGRLARRNGEGGTFGAPAAIANALADALAPLGIEIFELPMTPERLFRVIEQAKPRGQGEMR